MNLKNTPDPKIDWEYIHLTTASDAIRPSFGFRVCKSCSKVLAINSWNFSRNKRSPDGYSYYCKECSKKGRTPSPREGDTP